MRETDRERETVGLRSHRGAPLTMTLPNDLGCAVNRRPTPVTLSVRQCERAKRRRRVRPQTGPSPPPPSHPTPAETQPETHDPTHTDRRPETGSGWAVRASWRRMEPRCSRLSVELARRAVTPETLLAVRATETQGELKPERGDGGRQERRTEGPQPETRVNRGENTKLLRRLGEPRLVSDLWRLSGVHSRPLTSSFRRFRLITIAVSS